MATVAEMVAEAKARVENLTVEQTAREVEQGAVLVDIREPGERVENGAIPGTVEAPRGMLEFSPTPRARTSVRSSTRVNTSSCTAHPVDAPPVPRQ